MNAKKTFGIMAMMALMLIGVSGLVSATSADFHANEYQINATIITPQPSNATVAGAEPINVTIEHNASIEDWGEANLSIEINVTSSSLCNVSDIPIFVAQIQNDSLGIGVDGNGTQTTFGYSWDTTVMQDCNDYVLTVKVGNYSDHLVTTTVNPLFINNSLPITPVITDPAEKQIIENTTLVLKATIGSDNVTQCTFYFNGPNPGSSSYTVADNLDNTCYTTISKASENTFTVYATATDEIDTSAKSGDRTFSIDLPNKGGAGASYYTYEQQNQVQEAAAQQAQQSAQKGDNSTTLLILAVVVIVVFIINKKPDK